MKAARTFSVVSGTKASHWRQWQLAASEGTLNILRVGPNLGITPQGKGAGREMAQVIVEQGQEAHLLAKAKEREKGSRMGSLTPALHPEALKVAVIRPREDQVTDRAGPQGVRDDTGSLRTVPVAQAVPEWQTKEVSQGARTVPKGREVIGHSQAIPHEWPR